MKKIDCQNKFEEFKNIKNNKFEIGDIAEVTRFCDTEGNEINNECTRYHELFKKGKIDRVYGSDAKGGYVYSIEGAEYCFNRYELKSIK